MLNASVHVDVPNHELKYQSNELPGSALQMRHLNGKGETYKKNRAQWDPVKNFELIKVAWKKLHVNETDVSKEMLEVRFRHPTSSLFCIANSFFQFSVRVAVLLALSLSLSLS
eukprot:GEZU01024755.1.p1 GENE.GEZU01024755.1~~GEZU01024755.1.p1  ORF type:complete len:113 (-),score=0.34 GEZU01024755.1:341-679(-)